MALVIKDRVKETTTTTGSSDAYVLAGAVSGFETFTANLSNADTTYYVCTDNTDFEVGLGTFASSGTTLARTTILASSNSNNAVNWSSGTRSIFMTYPADKAVFEDASNNINGTFVGDITGDVTGNADTATALANARTIGGVSFNGTGNIDLPGVNASGNQDTSGNATTATTLANAREINGTSFNGSTNITVTAAAGTLTGNTLNSTVTASSLTSLGTLASNLNLGGQDIVTTTSNQDIDLAAHGTGKVVVKGNTNQGAIKLNCEANSHGQTIIAAPHSESASNTLTLPSTGGDARLVSTSSTATLTNKTLTTPTINGATLGSGNLATASNGDINLAPNGTGKVVIKGNTNQGKIVLNCEANSHGQTIIAAPHSESANNTLTLPSTGGDARLVSATSTATLTNKTLTSPVLNTGVSGTAIKDEDDMTSDSATHLATQQSIKAYVDAQKADMQFVLEDGDGTEVQITKDKEVKFVEGGGLDINWTDTSTGSDGDPYDLTFTINAAQTGITSLLATDIKIGEDDQTKIDFETADTINFYAGNEKQLILTDGALTPGADNILDLGSSSVEFKDAFFDGTVTSDAFAGPLTGDVTGNADTATALATGRTIGMTGDVVWTSASLTGAGNVTGTATIQSNAVETSMINADAVTGAKIADDAIDSEHYTDGSIDTAHIADDQVTQAKIADDAVGADQLASNAVVNASVSSSAAIAFSKMADLTASRALVSDGSGDVSVSAVTSTEIGYLDGVTSAIQTQLDAKTTATAASNEATALAIALG